MKSEDREALEAFVTRFAVIRQGLAPAFDSVVGIWFGGQHGAQVLRLRVYRIT